MALGFIDRIGELAIEYGPLVVHPAQEATLDPLALAGHTLPPQAILPYGDARALRILRDKAALAGLARDLGLPLPRHSPRARRHRCLPRRCSRLVQSTRPV
jgi:hypothetical protein